MNKDYYVCPQLETCKGKTQRKNEIGQTDWHCAYCYYAKERILKDLEDQNKKK